METNMGYYIEVPHPRGKAQQMVEIHQAELVLSPEKFDFSGPDALLCVVENPMWDAVAIAYNVDERDAFLPTKTDQRPRVWLKIPKTLAKQFQPNVPFDD